MFEGLLGQFQHASGQWATMAQVYALRLFYLLAALEIAWFAIRMMFERDGAAEFFSAILVKMMGMLFFWVLIQEAPVWLPTITASFIKAGEQIGAAGSSSGMATLDPSAVFRAGNQLAGKIIFSLQKASIWDSFLLLLIAGVTALSVVIVFSLISAQLLLVMVESYLVVGGGVLLLGFTGSSWTQAIGERLLYWVVNVGVRLFLLLLIVGLGMNLVDGWTQMLVVSQDQTLPAVGAYSEILGATLVFMIVAWNGPSLAAGLITGGAHHSLAHSMPSSRGMVAAAAFGVAQGMRLASTNQHARAGVDTLKAAAKAGQGGLGGVSREFQGGTPFPTAQGRAAWGISRAVNQQFKDRAGQPFKAPTGDSPPISIRFKDEPAHQPPPSGSGINRVTPRPPPPQNPPDPRETPVSIRFKQ